jgi:hypothetical protein
MRSSAPRRPGSRWWCPITATPARTAKTVPACAISAKLIADLLTTAGANRALFVDLHAAQIQGFFNIPVDHLFRQPGAGQYFRELNLPNLTVVSPDAGGVERARFFAQKIGAPLAIVDKRRTDMNVAEVMHVVGDVAGKTCLIIDDIIDTAGTLVKTVDASLDAARPPSTPAPATPCFRARPSTASPTRAWSRWWSPTPFRCAKRRRSAQDQGALHCRPVRRGHREHSHGDQRKFAVQLEAVRSSF